MGLNAAAQQPHCPLRVISLLVLPPNQPNPTQPPPWAGPEEGTHRPRHGRLPSPPSQAPWHSLSSQAAQAWAPQDTQGQEMAAMVTMATPAGLPDGGGEGKDPQWLGGQCQAVHILKV